MTTQHRGYAKTEACGSMYACRAGTDACHSPVNVRYAERSLRSGSEGAGLWKETQRQRLRAIDVCGLGKRPYERLGPQHFRVSRWVAASDAEDYIEMIVVQRFDESACDADV